MRILALNYEFPPLGGGAGNATAHICRELVGLGCEVEVLTSGFKDLPPEEEQHGYRIHRVPVLRSRLEQCSPLEMASFVPSAVRPAVRLARHFRPDIQHVYFGLPTGPVGLMVKRLTGVPYLLSLRGGDVPGFLPGTLGRWHRLTNPLTRRVWRNAAAIVANSEGLQALAQQSAPWHTVQMAPNGVDLDEFSPTNVSASDHALRQALRPGSGEPQDERPLRLLFVGRLVAQKGVRYVLQALPGLAHATQRPVEFVVVGSGPIEAELRVLARDLGVEPMVRFPGWAAHDEMPDYYRSADIFVFPSFEEGMPNVVLEAMASGLPVVASDIYGNHQLVAHEDNGLLVLPGDAGAVETALVRLALDDALRQRLGQRSRARAEALSWRATAQAYLELSQRVLAGEPAPDAISALAGP